MNRRFVVCIHDATPAYERETRAMIGDLAPILGRRLSFGVVPDWHGQWHLAAHPDYCHLVQESSAELLLHGYSHQRLRGSGPATFIAERSVGTARHYPMAPFLAPPYASLGYGEGAFPVAEAIARETLSLPMFPGISDEQVAAVVDGVTSFFDG